MPRIKAYTTIAMFVILNITLASTSFAQWGGGGLKSVGGGLSQVRGAVSGGLKQGAGAVAGAGRQIGGAASSGAKKASGTARKATSSAGRELGTTAKGIATKTKKQTSEVAKKGTNLAKNAPNLSRAEKQLQSTTSGLSKSSIKRSSAGIQGLTKGSLGIASQARSTLTAPQKILRSAVPGTPTRNIVKGTQRLGGDIRAGSAQIGTRVKSESGHVIGSATSQARLWANSGAGTIGAASRGAVAVGGAANGTRKTLRTLGADFVRGTQQAGTDIARETKQFGGEVAGETKRAGGDLARETKRLGGDFVREGKHFVPRPRFYNPTPPLPRMTQDDINREGRKAGRDINQEVLRWLDRGIEKWKEDPLGSNKEKSGDSEDDPNADEILNGDSENDPTADEIEQRPRKRPSAE